MKTRAMPANTCLAVSDDDDDDDDEVEVELVSSPLHSSSSSSSPIPTKKQKISAFDVLKRKSDAPLYRVEFPHSADHEKYARDHPNGDGVFGTIQILSKKGKKTFQMRCMGCGWARTGAVGKMTSHLATCKLANVDENTRVDHRNYLIKELEKFSAKHGRDPSVAVATREVLKPNVPTMFKDADSRRLALLQSVSRASLGCNWSMLQAENPYFRQMLLEVSHMKLCADDLTMLGRKNVANDMERHAESVQQNSKAQWTKVAQRFGGSFSVHGWTAAQNFGMIELALVSLGTVFYDTLIHSGKSSNAVDYLQKVVPALPLGLIFFMCTDGASNMLKLGRLMTEQQFVLPQLCAAHSFSLVNHYIGSCFQSEYGFLNRITGIVAFFNRSPQRMVALREVSGSNLGFIKVAKTRFAYMTFVFLRVLRLRSFAQIAMTKISPPKSKEEKDFESDSQYLKVKAALNDNELFADAELFVRVTFPVVLIMREFDRGSPMTGFVFWAFYCIEVQVKRILDEVVACDATKKEFRDEVLKYIAWMWGKRHTPLLSFAYLTNPLFHAVITESDESTPYDLADHFSQDVEVVLSTMIKKRYPEKSKQEQLEELSDVLTALDRYFQTPLSDLQKLNAQNLLASEWWNGSSAVQFGKLAYYATRAHAAPCVSSSLERFFSMMTNVQTTLRSSLDPQRAALFTAAHHEMISAAQGRAHQGSSDNETMQRSILEFVKRLETLLDSTEIPDIEAEGIRDVESWLESVAASGVSLIYRNESDESAATQSAQPALEQTTPTMQPESEGASTSSEPTVLEELSGCEEERHEVTSRIRRPPKRYIESC